MKRVQLCAVAAVVLGLLIEAAIAGESGANAILARREVSLGRLPTAMPHLWHHHYVSADKNHCAWVARDGDDWKVIVDGREGPAYEGIVSPFSLRAQHVSLALIPGLVVSPDGEHVAYGAARGGHEFVVLDGTEGHWYDVVAGLVFSPDSQRLAYEASHGTGVMVVVDGAEGATYGAIGGRDARGPASVQFSPDSRRVAYLAQRGGRSLVVLDGEEGEEYDHIYPQTLTFSPDSKHVTYRARRGNNPVTVLDGQEAERGGSVYFSPDGRRTAYWVRRGGKSTLVVDGEERGSYDNGGTVVFSGDGERMAVAVTSGGKQRVVVDGIAGEGHDEVMAVTFSPDGKRVAYLAATGGTSAGQAPGVSSQTTGRPNVAGGPSREMRAVVDGVAGNAYSEIRDLQFSPEGTRVAYVAATGGPLLGGKMSVDPDGSVYAGDVVPRKVRVVVDGVEGREYDHVPGRVVFSPDGSRMAYAVMRGGLQVVVVDGSEWGEYSLAHGLVFSPDSRHLVYAAMPAPRPSQGASVGSNGRSGMGTRPARGGRRGGVRARSGRRGRTGPSGRTGPGGRAGPSGSQARPAPIGATRPPTTSLMLVVDGAGVGGYSRLLTSPVATTADQPSVVFDAPNRFHTLVERDGEAVRVEVEIWED